MEVTAEGITFTTKGYGHRVGMSQYGAQAMALQGSAYRQILAHYYQGAELTRWSVP
jgi:stage II sporulation protein D